MSDIYGVKVKIEPIDILNRLDKKDRERFNSCINKIFEFLVS